MSQNLDEIIDSIAKYSEIIGNVVTEIDEQSIKTNNPYIGKVSNILKVVLGSMESPHDLDDLEVLAKMFAGHQLMKKIDDKTLAVIRENINNEHYWDEEKKDEEEK